MDNTHQAVVDRLQQRFKAMSDLAAHVDANLLSEKIDVPKHKSLAEHFWCLVGARESYTKAIEAGAWSGFACSLQELTPEMVRTKLSESAELAETAIGSISDWNPERSQLLATLAEHEVMHEGQIIRHMYALERELPDSIVWA